MLKAVLNQVVGGESLSRQEAHESMQTIMSGNASEAQIGGLLTALRIKGETSDEITGFAESMRSHTVKVSCSQTGLLDTCGTGGDRKGTFNISTAVAFVVAGAGVSVAKHGNHGVSSSCGSADVLKALGIRIDLPAQSVAAIIEDAQIGFLYAPTFHPAMKYAGKPRRELGFRTVFNVLGPLTNPLSAERQLMGVYDRSLTHKLAEVLLQLQTRRAMVVHGLDGLDEISTSAPTQVSEVVDGEIRSYMIDPADYGLPTASLDAISGGTPEENADIIKNILQGARGARRDLVLLNAAAALVVAGKAEDIKEGIMIAAESIDSGAALAKLDRMRELSLQ
ncbi:MAG TPA: anthranilate phosphoribosyltransferase [Negativicutes bacterium]|nr:anthranilate phosphoribosyltransferase [Negativicutes bacterium]